MYSTTRALLLAIALLLGTIVGIATALLARTRGAHLAVAIREGAVGFAGTVTLTVLLLTHLGTL
ncbi:hypothetical protein [Nocardia barduliensis]|uniref:hypothetical protein n=1 Tax=Nocardia barduliensis TaxID=2736643 RepID=UPI001573005B|nr:hypothetical protein [Nocardia barduliensis]